MGGSVGTTCPGKRNVTIQEIETVEVDLRDDIIYFLLPIASASHEMPWSDIREHSEAELEDWFPFPTQISACLMRQTQRNQMGSLCTMI